LWDAFIGEEMRLEKLSTNYKDEDDGLDLPITGKVRRSRKEGPKRGQKGKEEESNSSESYDL
jgi:hypothetical protein